MGSRELKTCKALHTQVEDLVSLVDNLKIQVSSKDKEIEKLYHFLCSSVGIHLGIALLYTAF